MYIAIHFLLDLPKKFIFVGDESVADLRRDLLDYL